MQCTLDSKMVLSVDAVSFTYKGTSIAESSTLQDISFHLEQGEFFSLLGPSGCGKSTLLRIIAGLQAPHSGHVDLCSSSGSVRRVGMVFQDLALFPHMSAARNIEFALKSLRRKDRQKRIDEVLELVNLSDKHDAYPYQLSGGQQQRLALARSLAPKPDLFLLDEPFASQDVVLRRRIRDEVIDILKQSGVAAILVTHDPEEAMYFSDRMAIMRDGQIEQIGTPETLYNHPVNAFVASFFGDVNIVEGSTENGILHTSIGPIPANGFEDGTMVQAIIRPEALRLQSHDPSVNHADPRHSHTHGFVRAQKYLGQSTKISLLARDIDHADSEDVALSACVTGHCPHNSDELYDIFVDGNQVLLFEKAEQA